MAFILFGASTRARAQEVTANRRERKQALWRAQDDERASKELPSFIDTSVVKDSVKDTLWISVLYSFAAVHIFSKTICMVSVMYSSSICSASGTLGCQNISLFEKSINEAEKCLVSVRMRVSRSSH